MSSPYLPTREPLWRRVLTVTITVSQGPEETTSTVILRDLRGLDEATARQVLDSSGLNYTSVSGYDNSYNIGDVIAMDPAPGTEVPEGTLVTLTINTEQETSSGEWVCQNTLPPALRALRVPHVSHWFWCRGDYTSTFYDGADPLGGRRASIQTQSTARRA